MLSLYGSPKMCLWRTSRAHLLLSRTNTNTKYVFHTIAKALFPTCSYKCNVQSCPVALMFFQNSYSRSMFLRRLTGNQLRKHVKTSTRFTSRMRFILLLRFCNTSRLQIRVLVKFCNAINVQPRLLNDPLFRRYRAW